MKSLLTLNALLLLVLALVTVQGSSLPAYLVPVLFAPYEIQVLRGESTRTYHAALCGGCSFDGLTAVVQIDLLNNPWDVDVGDYVTISVKDENGNVIATNFNGSKMPVPVFQFTYSSKYKDLFLHVKTGPAPLFTFTLGVLFDPKARVYVPNHCFPRWQMTASEHAVSQKYKQGNDTTELYQVFRTLSTQKVSTHEFKLFQLDFCFAKPGSYNVIIAVINDNLGPGLATYGCTMTYIKQYGKCVLQTPYRDISGLPMNVVQININKPADYGPIQVLVSSEGQYSQTTNFTIAARFFQLQ